MVACTSVGTEQTIVELHKFVFQFWYIGLIAVTENGWGLLNIEQLIEERKQEAEKR